jgi:hypothetical protein
MIRKAALAVAFVASVSGCGSEYVGTTEIDAAYVEAPVVTIDTYPRYRWHGTWVYQVDGHYYRHYHGRWYRYKQRPW